MTDAVEKDTAPTDNREEGTGQRILGQFHISVEENNVVVTHLGDADNCAVLQMPRFQECIDRLGSCF